MNVEVLGFKELDAALAELPAALRREVVLKALRRAADPMVREARARARRQPNPRRRGGYPAGEMKALADSIQVSAVKPNASFPKEAAVKLGPDADHFYGLFVEKGTQARGRVYRDNRNKIRRNTRGHAATRAFEYLAPAFAMHAERAAQAIGEELWEVLAERARSLAKKAGKGTLTTKAKEALLE